MTQNNFRKEPTFGSPSDKATLEPQQTSETVELETAKSVNTPNVSLHSNQVPSYTFTPVMKRPTNVEDSSKAVEEVQQEQAEVPAQTAENVAEEKVVEPEAVIAKATPKTSGFAFSPVTEDEKQDKAEEKPAM